MKLLVTFIGLLLVVNLLAITTVVAQKHHNGKARPMPMRSSVARPPALTPLNRLHFCGEVVPTEQGDVSTKLAVALAGNFGYVRHVNALKARSAPFFKVIEPILYKHSIPNDFKYLPLIESAWKADAVSVKGAVGYWQFMDDTAQDMGLSIAPEKDERTDLKKSTEAACRYLKFLYRKLGSWTLVAAAYNGGVGMVERKMMKTGHRDYYSMAMNAETGYYLYRILAMKELFTNPVYGVDAVGNMLAYTDNPYEREREQARRMGWLNDNETEPVSTEVERSSTASPDSRSETVIMDSVLTELLKRRSATAPVFVGDVAAKLVKAGPLSVGQSWTFALMEDVQLGEDELKAGDALYAVIEDVDAQGAIFLRATKVIKAQTKEVVSLTLMAINSATGLAGVPRPKELKAGWIIQWKIS